MLFHSCYHLVITPSLSLPVSLSCLDRTLLDRRAQTAVLLQPAGNTYASAGSVRECYTVGRRQWDKPTREIAVVDDLLASCSCCVSSSSSSPPPSPLSSPPNLSLFLTAACLVFSPSSLSSLSAAEPYNGIHPSFLRPRINTVRRRGPSPKAAIGQLPRSLLSLLLFPLTCIFCLVGGEKEWTQ